MQQACRQLFEQQTQQDNHSRPTKQIRHLQINFGIVKGFPDGILRQAQHFCSNSRFPANADAGAASSRKIWQQAGQIQIAHLFAKRKPVSFGHLQKIPVYCGDSLIQIRPYHWQHHQKAAKAPNAQDLIQTRARMIKDATGVDLITCRPGEKKRTETKSGSSAPPEPYLRLAPAKRRP